MKQHVKGLVTQTELYQLPILAALCLMVAGVVPAEASITYTYTGLPFTSFAGSGYTTSDFVFFTITLGSPIAANSAVIIGNDFGYFSNQISEYTPPVPTLTLGSNFLSWMITDQVQSFSSGVGTPRIFAELQTNAQGIPTIWEFIGEGTGGNMFNGIKTIISDRAFPGQPTGDVGQINGQSGVAFNSTPGTWSVENSGAVPEPCLCGVLGLCMAGLLGFSLKKRGPSV